MACFDHRSCPYHSAAPLIELPEYVVKHHAPRTSHCGCTMTILEDVENVRVGWPGGALSGPFVFWPVTEVWALGIGHYKMLVAQQHQHQHHFLQCIQHQRLSILVPQLFMALYSVRNMAQHASTDSVELTSNMRRNEHCLWQQWRDSSSSYFMNEDTCRTLASLPSFL